MAQPHRQPALPAARDRPARVARGPRRAGAPRGAGGHHRARGRRRATRGRTSRSPTATSPSPTGSAGCVELDDGTLRPQPPDTPAGASAGRDAVRALNAALDREGLALPNMGGYDAQTIAGVVSTSTHGSGLRWGPFPDLVRSLDLVVSGGEVVRVEPPDGPTDPAAFAAAHGDGRRLVQDESDVPGRGLRHRRARPDRIARARGAREVLAQRGAHGQHLGGGPGHADRGRRARRGRPLRAVRQPLRRQGRRAPGRRDAARRLPRARAPADGQGRARPAHGAGVEAADHRRAAASRGAQGAVAARVALRRHAGRAGRRRLRRGLLPGVQHRRGEQAAGLLDGARRPARGQPPPRGRRPASSRSPASAGRRRS